MQELLSRQGWQFGPAEDPADPGIEPESEAPPEEPQSFAEHMAGREYPTYMGFLAGADPTGGIIPRVAGRFVGALKPGVSMAEGAEAGDALAETAKSQHPVASTLGGLTTALVSAPAALAGGPGVAAALGAMQTEGGVRDRLAGAGLGALTAGTGRIVAGAGRTAARAIESPVRALISRIAGSAPGTGAVTQAATGAGLAAAAPTLAKAYSGARGAQLAGTLTQASAPQIARLASTEPEGRADPVRTWVSSADAPGADVVRQAYEKSPETGAMAHHLLLRRMPEYREAWRRRQEQKAE